MLWLPVVGAGGWGLDSLQGWAGLGEHWGCLVIYASPVLVALLCECAEERGGCLEERCLNLSQ